MTQTASSIVGCNSEYNVRHYDAQAFWNLEHYQASGATDVVRYVITGKCYGIPNKRNAALDFGCGAGRLTQALCRYFSNCVGIDSDPEALEVARARNRYPMSCRYLHREEDDVGGFSDNSFDLVSAVAAVNLSTSGCTEEFVSSLIRMMSDGGLLVLRTSTESVPNTPPWAVSTTYEQALPITAFRARICSDCSEVTLRPGARMTLPVRVTNESLTTWPANGRPDGAYQVKLGNRWYTTDGEMSVLDDGRTTLPHDVLSGSEITLSLSIAAPLAVGSYVVEVDMVQEFVGWFASGGAQPYRMPVHVCEHGPGIVPEPATAREQIRRIPHDELERILHDCGAALVDVQDAGPDGATGRYRLCFVTK